MKALSQDGAFLYILVGMNEPLTIQFGIPSHGWLPVDFKAGSLILDFHASDVLNDPLDELYASIQRLLDHKTGEVTWWMEPHTYYFYFERTGVKDFRLTISEAKDIEGKKEQMASFDGTYKELIAPMRKALLQFCDYVYDERQWPFSYKKEDVDKLPKGL
jgi:hypothetical protein